MANLHPILKCHKQSNICQVLRFPTPWPGNPRIIKEIWGEASGYQSTEPTSKDASCQTHRALPTAGGRTGGLIPFMPSWPWGLIAFGFQHPYATLSHFVLSSSTLWSAGFIWTQVLLLWEGTNDPSFLTPTPGELHSPLPWALLSQPLGVRGWGAYLPTHWFHEEV